MVAGALLAPAVIAATSLRASFLLLGAAAVAVALAGRAALRGLDAASARRTQELEARVAALETLPLAAGVPRLVIERLAAASALCPLPAGVDVVVQGAPAHALFGVVDGSLVVHRNGVEVARLGPGEAFGERGLLDNAPRNATVTTRADATLLRIDGEALIDALRAAPALRPALDLGGSGPEPAGLVEPVAIEDATVVIVSAGYPGKRRIYERLAQLGAHLVIVDEPGHWSEGLVGEGLADRWLPVRVTGDADTDAHAVLATLREAGVRPDAVMTFWEDSVPVAARITAALGLPGNPVSAVDAARSKLRTRETFARLGLPTPRAIRVRSLDELYAAAADLGFPAVIKPEFGALAAGCVRIDDFAALPDVYRVVRNVVSAEADDIFRAGNDLLLEEYLDGVEFDVDLVFEDGACVFSSVSQNWPTAEPSFQETGLHLPPDHSPRAVRRMVDFCIEAAQAFGFATGVLHIEAKATSRGPRVVEINARMGGGRIHEMVEAVWGVDLIAAQLRASLGLPQQLRPSRRPRCAIVHEILYAQTTGRLAALSFGEVDAFGELGVRLDVEAHVGERVEGPEAIFATPLAEVVVSGRDLAHARALKDELLREPPRIDALAPAPA
jgi:carnosine synthase